MLSTLDIPFELWHDILRQVYDGPTLHAHLDDPTYVLSPLHHRLQIHRSLSLVSKHFHELSSSVFLESLDLHAPEHLLGFSNILKKDPSAARIPRRLSFNFHDYRCGASVPRRPRELKPMPDDPAPISSSNDLYAEDAATQAQTRWRLSMELSRRTARKNYTPSTTRQASHFIGWTGFVRSILSLCTGVSSVSIDFTADYSQHAQRPNARNYRTLFGSPDLNSDAVLTGLLEAKNVRELKLVDPSPLDAFGSSLGKWKALRSVEIMISESYPEARRLSNATFIPPPLLTTLKLINRSSYIGSLPLTSDISSCPSLTTLDLGMLNLTDTASVTATSFLIRSYAHCLEHLTLRLRTRGMLRDVSALLGQGTLEFPELKTLIIRHGTCELKGIRAEGLERIEMRSMIVDLSPFMVPSPSQQNGQSPEDAFWASFFFSPSLTHLKTFRIHIFHLSASLPPPPPTNTTTSDLSVPNPPAPARPTLKSLRASLDRIASSRGIDTVLDPLSGENEPLTAGGGQGGGWPPIGPGGALGAQTFLGAQVPGGWGAGAGAPLGQTLLMQQAQAQAQGAGGAPPELINDGELEEFWDEDEEGEEGEGEDVDE